MGRSFFLSGEDESLIFRSGGVGPGSWKLAYVSAPRGHKRVSVPGMNPKLLMLVLGLQLFASQSAKQQRRFYMSI